MNYGDIERQTFRTFLAFAMFILIGVVVFFNLTTNLYRVSNINYDDSLDLNFATLENLRGTSIWLIDDTYFDRFYTHNPSVEKISIKKELPNTLLVNIVISENLAYVQDNRQSPPKTFIIHKNLYTRDVSTNEGLMTIKINNGPVKEGFNEEIVTFVMTLKKYTINLKNIELRFDGEKVEVSHINTEFDLGSPYDLARKAAVLGYYISDQPCEGEVKLVYSEDGSEIRAVTNCN